MKRSKFKKLNLNRVTISNLSRDQMLEAGGGWSETETGGHSDLMTECLEDCTYVVTHYVLLCPAQPTDEVPTVDNWTCGI